jgi:putative hydrolase of the HAD superfamily
MEESPSLKAVLFDVDDTLFDRRAAVQEILYSIVRKLPEVFANIEKNKVYEAFREADEVARLEFERGLAGEVVRDTRSRMFLKILGLPLKYGDIVTELYIEAYPGINAPVKDAKNVVEILSDEFMLGIISNAFPDTQYNKLEGIGLRDKFEIILLSEEIGIRKPDREIFLKAANLLDIKPGECVFVGDSYTSDVIGAKRSGMKACWFNFDNKEICGAVIPDYEISELSELPEILLCKNGNQGY